MHAKAHILRDVAPRTADLEGDEYDRTAADAELRRNRVAFTSLLLNPNDDLLYCGLTAWDADIFYTFEPGSGTFTSLNWADVGEPFEVKIHRSLCLHPDGTMYGATACLHEIPRRMEAPGGKVFSYDPRTNSFEILATPSPPDYIQTITLDAGRGLIYGFTYPVFKFFKYDIASREVTDYDYIGSITHISALDDKGRLWGTWHSRAHNLFCCDPDADEITWFDHSIPNAREGSDLMYAGAGPVDSMINGGDGYLYIGTTLGTLVRLDPETAEVTFLGKPYAERRMPGLLMGDDGLIYGSGGDGGSAIVYSYDRDSGSFRTLGELYDPELDTTCYRTHDIAIVGDTFYVAETDNPRRSGYLWECALER